MDIKITEIPPAFAERRKKRPRRNQSDRVYIYRTDRYSRGAQRDRRGKHCLMLARGTMNSCLIQFDDDGQSMITSRNAVKRWMLPAARRAPLLQTRARLAPLRKSDSPRARAATVIVQAVDEALQTPGALADITGIMRDNLKRFADPTLDAVSLPQMSPEEIVDAIVPDPEPDAEQGG